MKTFTTMRLIIVLMIAAAAAPHSTTAQIIEWQKTIGGDHVDFLYSIQQTTDGGYILGGWSISNISGEKTENSRGAYDYWIVKTDATGNIQWQKTFGGNNADWLLSIQQTTDGGYILGGYSESNISGEKTENSRGYYDYWIVKTDATGNIQWQKTIGGSVNDRLTEAQQTADGGYILAGFSDSNISGEKTENSRGGSDYWIVKTDATGNIQWQKTIGGNSYDELKSIQQTTDGGYILGGYSESNISGEKSENSRGANDFWIVKTDSTGNIQWQKTIGGSGDDKLYSIQQTTDGGYILGGKSDSNISGEKTENSRGFEDYWIVKIDSVGIVQWQKTIGGSKYEWLFSIQQTTDGGYILGGYSDSNISGEKTENSRGGADYWIVKTDASGNIQWQKTIGGSGLDYLISTQLTTDGGYMLGGFSHSNISGEKTESNRGGVHTADYWIIKLNDKFNMITGKLFADLNSNQLHDAGEPDLKHKMVTEINTGRIGFSSDIGIFSITVPDTGSYNVQPQLLNYYSSMPTNHNALFTAFQQTDSLNNFAFQPTSMFNDLCASITPTCPFRPGFQASYMINYHNAGTTTINNCSIVFHPHSTLSYVSSNTTPAQINTDSVVWNIGTLVPFQSGSIVVTVLVNVGTPIGTMINSWVRIVPIIGDVNQACNYDEMAVTVTGSYDPNDILVNLDMLFSNQVPNPPFLEYTIRFQNTGNDTAFFVKILNPLDTTKLQLNTLELVATSHPLTSMQFVYHEKNMLFKFDNILLPDSNVNEPMSHGFVRYRIKPKTTLVVNDTIKNQAFIYFDFNAPVATNTATTAVVLTTGVPLNPPHTARHLSIFPNPGSQSVTIRGAEGELKIIDMLGKVVYRATGLPHSQDHTLNVSRFPAGMYIVESGTVRVKFLKY